MVLSPYYFAIGFRDRNENVFILSLYVTKCSAYQDLQHTIILFDQHGNVESSLDNFHATVMRSPEVTWGNHGKVIGHATVCWTCFFFGHSFWAASTFDVRFWKRSIFITFDSSSSSKTKMFFVVRCCCCQKRVANTEQSRPSSNFKKSNRNNSNNSRTTMGRNMLY